jgi:plastocyanin
VLSRAETVGFALAIVMIAIMGALVAHGPFHNINKAHAASGPPLHVTIVSDPQTIGRYKPATIHARVGEKVIFTNNSNANHTATEVHNTFNTGDIGTGGQTATITPTKAGTFQYYCVYHPYMKGTIVVSP